MTSQESNAYLSSLSIGDKEQQDRRRACESTQEEKAYRQRIAELEAKVSWLTAQDSLKDTILFHQSKKLASLNEQVTRAIHMGIDLDSFSPDLNSSPQHQGEKGSDLSSLIIKAKEGSRKLPTPVQAPLRLAYKSLRFVYRSVKK